MKFRKLTMPVLLCNAVLLLHAQPPGVKANLATIQKQYTDAMRVRYDTAKHCVVWPQQGNGNTMFDMKNLSEATIPQLIDKSAAANFHLTKDLNASKDSYPYNFSFTNTNSQFAVLNNVSYFSADDGIHGNELWRSDGTAAGTYMVKDINPGPTSSNVYEVTVAKGKLYFSATTTAEGQELWTSDGTEAGTQLLKDLVTGGGNGSPSFIYEAGNTVFFTSAGSNYLFSSQLWKTDGTTAGTVMIKDLYVENNGTNAAFQFSSANGLLYFTATSYNYGRELWRSDGTAAGTYMIKDINPITYDYDGPAFLTPYNNRLYFVANDGTGRKLWSTDGTALGTIIAPGGNGVTFEDAFFFQNLPFAIIGNTLCMKATTPATGGEMYKYNAANNAGIVLLKDATPGTGGSNIDYYSIIAVDSTLFFPVNNADGSYSLWASKGTGNTTFAVKNFGVQETMTAFANGYGKLLFSKYDNTSGYELWKSDGTTIGTALVADINPGNYSSSPYNFTQVNGQVLFSARTLSKGLELWKTDATATGAQQVKDINKTTTSGSYVNSYSGSQGILSGGIVYAANTPQYGTEVYRSDGTAAGTKLLADIIPGENSSNLQNFISKPNNVYFTSIVYTTGSPSIAIYKTNGLTVTKLVDVDYYNYYVNSIAAADNGGLFYQVYNNYTGQNEVWRTDGTPGGTVQLYAGFSYNSYIAVAGNTAYFAGNDNINGTELWKSDGTVAGTQMVKDIFPGNNSANPYDFFAFKNKIYFAAVDGNSGYDNSFWTSDGTAAGTIRLASIFPSQANNLNEISRQFCVSNNALYFAAFSYDYGSELWKTDGTVAGTVLVKDINPGYADARPYYLTDVNGVLFFTADDGVNGNELWATNGKPNKTGLIKDLTPGISPSYFDGFCSAAGKCFFSSNGYLWYSDGSTAGTNQVADSALVNVTSITGLIASGNKIFFGGYTYQYGQELYEGDASLVSAAAVNNEQQDAVIANKPLTFNAKISPNPVTANAMLHLSGDVKNAGITLSDMNGKILWSTTSLNGALQVSIPADKLTAGIYIITVNNGTATKTIKLVKQ
ncbi:MAG TPA: T9SS type A sorting domain-containing protein [Panacibacter sp.]|nr:T9SS type A sorting domain-containing protein [Panacibacter sp.]